MQVNDPLHDIIYTFHHPAEARSGTNRAPTIAQMNAAFGNLADKGIPVVDGEFANYKGSYAWFDPARTVPRYLAYATAHHIGVLAWSLLPGALNNSMSYASVSRFPQGDGAAMKRWFAATAAASRPGER